MKITHFDADDLKRVSKWLETRKNISVSEMEDVLQTVNISFVLEGIHRLQSTLLCELKASYVQQSQRYVTMEADGYVLPELTLEENEIAKKLIDKSFALYKEMTVRQGDKKGRLTAEDFLYGIPVEDARYILPLTMKTNLSVSMSGDGLIRWWTKAFKHPKYELLFRELKEQLAILLPENIYLYLEGMECQNAEEATEVFYQEEFDKISAENPMVYLHGLENLNLKVGLGALTSTKAETPSEVIAQWGEEAENKAMGVVERVLGYGHESVAEQARTTFGMMCSMVTYHQQIRHRLPSLHRETLRSILRDENRPIVIPPTIAKSIFAEKCQELYREFFAWQQQLAGKYNDDRWACFLLNGQQVKLVLGTNARMDCGILRERICRNAQWEIRGLAERKLLKLRELSSVLYRAAVPPCVYGACKEGKMTCGHAAEMRLKYRTIYGDERHE